MFKVDCEEGFIYLYGINSCWFVVNEVEVIEMEIIIIIFILGECIVIIIEFVYFFWYFIVRIVCSINFIYVFNFFLFFSV